MLFRRQWDKPSVLSMLLFCESKPANKAYKFNDVFNCPCAQFSHAMGMVGDEWWNTFDENMPMWRKLNFLAFKHPRTFGALAGRLRQNIET